MYFYMVKCNLTKNANGYLTTRVYKIGVTTKKTAHERGILSEWRSLAEGSKSNSDLLQIDYTENEKDQLTIDEYYNLEADDYFIKELEDICKKNIFKNDTKAFKKRTEYFGITEQIVIKFEQLKKNLEKQEVHIIQINNAVNELSPTQTANFKILHKQYDEILKTIKDNFQLPTLKSDNKQSQLLIETSKQNLKSIESSLKNDFVYFVSNKNQKHMLWHTKYHAGKDPNTYGGSFSISGIESINYKNKKFQFQKSFAEKYNYIFLPQINLRKVENIMKKSVVDYDALTPEQIMKYGFTI